jgi:hypothetical protein
MQNVARGFANGPKPLLAVVAALILPDQHPSLKNTGAIVKADPALLQVLRMLRRIPLELPIGTLRLKV